MVKRSPTGRQSMRAAGALLVPWAACAFAAIKALNDEAIDAVRPAELSGEQSWDVRHGLALLHPGAAGCTEKCATEDENCISGCNSREAIAKRALLAGSPAGAALAAALCASGQLPGAPEPLEAEQMLSQEDTARAAVLCYGEETMRTAACSNGSLWENLVSYRRLPTIKAIVSLLSLDKSCTAAHDKFIPLLQAGSTPETTAAAVLRMFHVADALVPRTEALKAAVINEADDKDAVKKVKTILSWYLAQPEGTVHDIRDMTMLHAFSRKEIEDAQTARTAAISREYAQRTQNLTEFDPDAVTAAIEAEINGLFPGKPTGEPSSIGSVPLGALNKKDHTYVEGMLLAAMATQQAGAPLDLSPKGLLPRAVELDKRLPDAPFASVLFEETGKDCEAGLAAALAAGHASLLKKMLDGGCAASAASPESVWSAIYAGHLGALGLLADREDRPTVETPPNMSAKAIVSLETRVAAILAGERLLGAGAVSKLAEHLSKHEKEQDTLHTKYNKDLETWNKKSEADKKKPSKDKNAGEKAEKALQEWPAKFKDTVLLLAGLARDSITGAMGANERDLASKYGEVYIKSLSVPKTQRRAARPPADEKLKGQDQQVAKTKAETSSATESAEQTADLLVSPPVILPKADSKKPAVEDELAANVAKMQKPAAKTNPPPKGVKAEAPAAAKAKLPTHLKKETALQRKSALKDFINKIDGLLVQAENDYASAQKTLVNFDCLDAESNEQFAEQEEAIEGLRGVSEIVKDSVNAAIDDNSVDILKSKYTPEYVKTLLYPYVLRIFEPSLCEVLNEMGKAGKRTAKTLERSATCDVKKMPRWVSEMQKAEALAAQQPQTRETQTQPAPPKQGASPKPGQPPKAQPAQPQPKAARPSQPAENQDGPRALQAYDRAIVAVGDQRTECRCNKFECGLPPEAFGGKAYIVELRIRPADELEAV